LGTLVNEQQYLVDNIESNIENTLVNTRNANEQLNTASVSQKSTRGMLWYCFLALFAMVIIIVVLYLIFRI
jgi:syntaxin 7